jgi:hypothetical protein
MTTTMSENIFPTLQGESVSGKSKVWCIRVVNDNGNGIIETMHGYLDGKMQTNKKTIQHGKNIGKKNETTPYQQAFAEAHTSWTKKKETGYTEQNNTNSVGTSKSKGISAELPLPMLAHEYNKRGKGFVFPCYTQPKLDGTRCLGVQGKGLFSRLRKPFPHMEHIVEELNRMQIDSFILDGELYSDELTFQEIIGLVKRETLKPGDLEKQRKIKFHIYDIMMDAPFEIRLNYLRKIMSNNIQHIVVVETQLCGSDAEMKQQHNGHVANGYEGIMLRSKTGMYKHSRSIDLLKYKEFLDSEYEVIDFKEGEGLEKGCVIWICRTEQGKVFYCRPRGSREERMELFTQGTSYIGKMLTVRYQEMTSSEEKVPRFPVGIAFRDYE